MKTEDGWIRSPNTPVLQRSLFFKYDRWGMDKLDVVKSETGLTLFYIGRNQKQSHVLCYAESKDKGLNWKKLYAVTFSTNTIPSPIISEPNGKLPGKIENYAVKIIDNKYHVFMIINVTGSGRALFHATGVDLKNLNFNKQSVCSELNFNLKADAFDIEYDNNKWLLNFVFNNKLKKYIWDGNENIPTEISTLNLSQKFGNIIDLRLHNSELFLSAAKTITNNTPEESTLKTVLFTQTDTPSSPGTEIKGAGRAAQPTYISRTTKDAGVYLQIISAFVIFLAIINLSIFHSKKIAQKQKGFHNSIIFFSFFIAMTVFAYMGFPEDMKGTIWKKGFNFLFESVQKPMGAAVFSLNTFFMISAAYRAFKVRTVEAALLMCAAMIVMIGQMPVGEWFTSSVPANMQFFKLPWLSQKILTVVNAAAYRGVFIGIIIGGISISLRIWLGLDNSVYSGLDKK